MSVNKFVFVVCGAKEHMDTLHFSIRALKKFSRNEIIVVTDTSRNEIPVGHDTILDIKTPEHFTHHQASIYLKTGLNKFLEKGNNYCYLDSDIVALDIAVDQIFEEYVAPVTFCTDHCRLDEFSPSAIYCGCWEAFQMESKRTEGNLDGDTLPGWLYVNKCLEEIETTVAQSKVSKWNYRWHQLKYFMPGRFYHLNSRYKMDKKRGLWYDENDVLLKYGHDAKDPMRAVTKNTGFRFDHASKKWHRVDHADLPTRHCCRCLEKKLMEKFGIHVHPPDWQHWNGGVFLFNDESSAFLEYWHEATMAIFEDKEWRTRDQGTLVASAWHFGMQDARALPIEYNLIADYYSETYDIDKIEYAGDLTFKIGAAKKTVKPHFIHLYHHWGDIDWDVWRDVERHVTG